MLKRREEVAGGWRKLHNEENQGGGVIWAEHVACMVEVRSRRLLRQACAKRASGRPECWRMMMVLIMELEESGYEAVDWIHLYHDKD
jgi:hypothetical protein